MKRIVIILLALAVALGVSKNPRLQYIDDYHSLAVEEMKRTGVPASITLAQGMIESRAGQSPLATKGNNHFGIKCHNDWTGKKMYQDDDEGHECFRVYASAKLSYRDHSDFLRSKDRYKALFDLDPTDYKSWAKGLKRAGYATDPDYAAKLINVIEDFELYKYDDRTAVGVAPPSELESPKEVSAEELASKYKESVRYPLSRKVYKQNDVPFIISMEGETYQSIAEANDLFVKELLRFNDLPSDTALDPGTIVYLSRKKSQAAYGVPKYVVEGDDETLRGIAQRFGVRLSSLEQYNIFQRGKKLEEGDTVILRKL